MPESQASDQDEMPEEQAPVDLVPDNPDSFNFIPNNVHSLMPRIADAAARKVKATSCQ